MLHIGDCLPSGGGMLAAVAAIDGDQCRIVLAPLVPCITYDMITLWNAKVYCLSQIVDCC